jgi:hypothetical protein
MTKIDDKTSVPFFWLITAVVFSCGGAWTTAWFAFTVENDIHDLQKDVKQLKAKEGIPEEASADDSHFFIHEVKASTK